MRELIVRLAGTDEESKEAVRLIDFFDTLVKGRVSLEAVVRGAAAMANTVAGFSDPDRRLNLCVGPDGVRLDDFAPIENERLVQEVEDSAGVVWIARAAAQPADAMLLERFASAAAIVAERLHGRSVGPDPAMVDILLDPSSGPGLIERAIARLGLAPGTLYRAAVSPLAEASGSPPPRGCLVLRRQDKEIRVVSADTDAADLHLGSRVALGPAVYPAQLQRSFRDANDALKLLRPNPKTGPSMRNPLVAKADDLGPLLLIARYIAPESAAADPTVRLLDECEATGPWAIETLEIVTQTSSARQAASQLYVHHSTLMQRLARLEQVLGFSLQTNSGRLRIQLALALRNIVLNRELT